MLESLSLINLFVRDVPTSRTFYCDLLGVAVASPADDPEIDLMRFDNQTR